MTQELRRHPRFSVDVQANVRTGDGRKLPAARDLSAPACVSSPQCARQRDELLIDLILLLGPTPPPNRCRCGLAWCGGTPISQAFQVGAMFEKLSKTEQSFLDMFLRYLDGSILPAGAELETWARRQNRRQSTEPRQR